MLHAAPSRRPSRRGRRPRARRCTAGSTPRSAVGPVVRRATRRTRSPRRGAPEWPPTPIPARFARATASASPLTSVAHTSASGNSHASHSASAPDPVPRSATGYSVSLTQGSPRPRRSPRRTASSTAAIGHHLGLGAGHEHTPVDEEVELEELPTAEHVLQRLAPGAPLEHPFELGDGGTGGRFVLAHHQFDTVVARHPLHHPAGLGVGRVDTHGAQHPFRMGAQLGPGAGGRAQDGSPTSCAARSAAASASVRSSS